MTWQWGVWTAYAESPTSVPGTHSR
jgi:hypothetical protein